MSEAAAGSTGPTNATRRPAETRSRLLAAAVDLFAERGYDGVRVRDIAARAGVTTGAIYAHYDDVASLLVDAAGRAVDHAVEAAMKVAPDGLAGALRGIVANTSARRLSREQGLLLEAFVAARREPTLQEVFSEVLQQRLNLLEKAVEQAQQSGEIRADLPAGAVAWFFYLVPVGLLAGRAVELPGPDVNTLGDVFEAVFSGLRPSD